MTKLIETRVYTINTLDGPQDLTVKIYEDGKINLTDHEDSQWVEHWPQARPWLSEYYPMVAADLTVNPPAIA